jgi:hypothetical protein
MSIKALRKFLSPKSKKKKPGTRKHLKPLGRTLASAEIRLEPTTGFTKLRGELVYLQKLHKARLTISAPTAPGNLGPNIFRRSTIDWDRNKTAREGRKLLESTLQSLARAIRSKSFPKTDVQIEKCDPTGKGTTAFIERQCVRCSCWYCEMSDG